MRQPTFGPADVIVKARAIHSMSARRCVYRSLAVRGAWIVGTSDQRDGLDAMRGAHTRVLDDPQFAVLPAFVDSHERLLHAARNLDHVAVDGTRSLAELIGLIRSRAAETAPGHWIQTSTGWHESQLAEGRLPSSAELDGATAAHPVACRRGRECVANSLALRLAGIDAGASCVLRGPAVKAIDAVVRRRLGDEQGAELGRACAAYAAVGVGAVREALLEPGQAAVYQLAWERGLLTIRCRVLLLVDSTWPLEERLSFVEAQQLRSGFGDDWLKLTGLKLVMNGDAPDPAPGGRSAGDPIRSRRLRWEPDEFAEVVEFAVSRGWRVATYATGDRAVGIVLGTYGQVAQRHPSLAAGTLAIEHGFPADPEERRRAAALGVGFICTGAGMPLRSLLADGVLVGAGSDAVRPVSPLASVFRMVTGNARDRGLLGAEEAIDRHAAVELLTRAGARLTGEHGRRGTLEPGRLADLVIYALDPMTAEIDQLPQLEPVLTLIGGRARHDPVGLLA